MQMQMPEMPHRILNAILIVASVQMLAIAGRVGTVSISDCAHECDRGIQFDSDHREARTENRRERPMNR